MNLRAIAEVMEHCYDHAPQCPCQFPARQRALKARLLAKRGLTEKQPHIYDRAKYAPIRGGGFVDLVSQNNHLLKWLARR